MRNCGVKEGSPEPCRRGGIAASGGVERRGLRPVRGRFVTRVSSLRYNRNNHFLSNTAKKGRPCPQFRP